MAAASVNNPPLLTGKRKRATVSYAELEDAFDLDGYDQNVERSDDAAILDDDQDESFGTRRKKSAKKSPPKTKQKAKIVAAQKPKKKSFFRFLDLPPELRDMIYDLALTDANGVSIVGYQESYRHVARRGKVYASDAYRQTYRRRNHRYLKDGDQQEVSPIKTKFIPALLAVNKQIHDEGINLLYGHDFVFEDPTALHSFLAMIGPFNQKRLLNVGIMAWGQSGVGKGNNHSGMTLLSGATNLKALNLMCDVGYYSNKPQWIARRLFRDGHWFFEAYGAANGRKDAVVDIIHMSDENFKARYYRNEEGDATKDEQRFRTELSALLGVMRAAKKSTK